MKSVFMKVAVFILMAGLLSACGSQSTDTPTSPPGETAVSATQAPTDPPAVTDTSAPPTTEPATATQPAAQGSTVSFANDVLPILDSRCVNCHGGNRTENSLSLKSYDDLMAGSENGPVLTSGNAADSKLVELIVSQKMPKRGPKLTPDQVQLITDWVNQGALNN